MQFLVLTEQNTPPPPEMVLPLIGAMEAWVARHRADGKVLLAWSYAGRPGGGGVLEVGSPEELDVIMAGFPFGPFSTIKVYALSDLDQSLVTLRTAVQQMMEMMGGKP
jgi:muconolactone delta-isomerase